MLVAIGGSAVRCGGLAIVNLLFSLSDRLV